MPLDLATMKGPPPAVVDAQPPGRSPMDVAHGPALPAPSTAQAAMPQHFTSTAPPRTPTPPPPSVPAGQVRGLGEQNAGASPGGLLRAPAFLRTGTVGNTQFRALNRGTAINNALMQRPGVTEGQKGLLQQQNSANSQLLSGLTGLTGKGPGAGEAAGGSVKGPAPTSAGVAK